MLFGRKKEKEGTNPYYNSPAAGPAPRPQPAPQAPSQNQPAQAVQDNTPAPFPTPILPIPEPLSPAAPVLRPMWESRPSGSTIGNVTSTTAFIKLSDYKQILEDIKALEKQVDSSKDELNKLGSILEQEKATLSNYAQLVNNLEKVINDTHASLSNIQT